jgi:hypothetical protein
MPEHGDAVARARRGPSPSPSTGRTNRRPLTRPRGDRPRVVVRRVRPGPHPLDHGDASARRTRCPQPAGRRLDGSGRGPGWRPATAGRRAALPTVRAHGAHDHDELARIHRGEALGGTAGPGDPGLRRDGVGGLSTGRVGHRQRRRRRRDEPDHGGVTCDSVLGGSRRGGGERGCDRRGRGRLGGGRGRVGGGGMHGEGGSAHAQGGADGEAPVGGEEGEEHLGEAPEWRGGRRRPQSPAATATGTERTLRADTRRTSQHPGEVRTSCPAGSRVFGSRSGRSRAPPRRT